MGMKGRGWVLWIFPALCGVLFLGGCGEPPTVQDETAIRKTRSVLVLPLHSSDKSVSGTVVAGMIGPYLQQKRPGGITVTEAPVLWRLGANPSQSGELSDDQALDLARKMGVDGVLTGSVDGNRYSDPGRKTPMNMSDDEATAARAQTMTTMQPRQRVKTGPVRVRIRLLSLSSGTVVFDHVAQSNGSNPAIRLHNAMLKAIEPLVKCWNKSEQE